MEKLSKELQSLVFTNKESIPDGLFKSLMDLSKKSYEKEGEKDLYRIKIVYPTLQKMPLECDCSYDYEDDKPNKTHDSYCDTRADGTRDHKYNYRISTVVKTLIVETVVGDTERVLQKIADLQQDISKNGWVKAHCGICNVFKNMDWVIAENWHDIDKLNDTYVNIMGLAKFISIEKK